MRIEKQRRKINISCEDRKRKQWEEKWRWENGNETLDKKKKNKKYGGTADEDKRSGSSTGRIKGGRMKH